MSQNPQPTHIFAKIPLITPCYLCDIPTELGPIENEAKLLKDFIKESGGQNPKDTFEVCRICAGTIGPNDLAAGCFENICKGYIHESCRMNVKLTQDNVMLKSRLNHAFTDVTNLEKEKEKYAAKCREATKALKAAMRIYYSDSD